MRSIQRLVTLGAAVAALVALGACSRPAQEPSTATDIPPVPTVAASGPMTPPPAPGSTTAADVFGPDCSGLPGGDDPGSLSSMSLAPIAGAIESNPQLTTMAALIGRANLTETFNAAPGITLFAPTNNAFDKLPPDQLAALQADPAKLATVMQYHASGTRQTADELRRAGSSTELAGGTVQIGGSGDQMTVAGGSGTSANVLCGNIPTGNGTLFIIDSVLLPQS